jgi:MFS family permease
MTMAPVHMGAHGHGLQVVGLAISLHIAGMFLPAPFAGWLTDRVGAQPVASVAAVLLVVAGVVAGVAGHGAAVFTAGLVLLGIGWNFALIAGSTLLASAVSTAQRPRVEGAAEVSMGIAAGTATAIAGPVVGVAGYGALAVGAAAAAAMLAPALVAAARRTGPPSTDVPAPRMLS